MAKQVGLFGLRGKIENKSFYKTAGVPETVIRGIPEGLSSRVKNDDAYANTRLNNKEFKTANALATAAFNSVNTRKRGMLRRFAIASMTKKALEDIKQGTGTWGTRLPLSELDVLICDMLENHAKGGPYSGEFGTINVTALTAEGTGNTYVNIPVEVQNQWLAMGVNGIMPVVSVGLAGEKVVDGDVRLFQGTSISPLQPIVFTGESAIEIQAPLNVSTPSSVGMSPAGYTFAQEDSKHGFYEVVTILPFRQEGGSRYIMQEYCTYIALPVGQIPD